MLWLGIMFSIQLWTHSVRIFSFCPFYIYDGCLLCCMSFDNWCLIATYNRLTMFACYFELILRYQFQDKVFYFRYVPCELIAVIYRIILYIFKILLGSSPLYTVQTQIWHFNLLFFTNSWIVTHPNLTLFHKRPLSFGGLKLRVKINWSDDIWVTNPSSSVQEVWPTPLIQCISGKVHKRPPREGPMRVIIIKMKIPTNSPPVTSVTTSGLLALLPFFNFGCWDERVQPKGSELEKVVLDLILTQGPIMDLNYIWVINKVMNFLLRTWTWSW